MSNFYKRQHVKVNNYKVDNYKFLGTANNVAVKDCMNYAELSATEKSNFAAYCCSKINGMKNDNIVKKLFGWLKGCKRQDKSLINSNKRLSKCFLDLQWHLEVDARNNSMIFCREYNVKKAEKIAKEMHNDVEVDFSIYTTYKLAGIYIEYIKTELNGVVPENIIKSLLTICKDIDVTVVESCDNYRELIKCLLFVFCEDPRCVLQCVFRLLEDIAISKQKTVMDIKGLLMCVAPSIVNQDYIKTKMMLKQQTT